LSARHWGRFSWLAALGLGGFTLGLMSLVHYSEWMKARGDRRATPLVGPGVHNFGEGLAIGQAAAASKISLAVTLIIGFGLHNATEGFGICGPMSGEGTR